MEVRRKRKRDREEEKSRGFKSAREEKNILIKIVAAQGDGLNKRLMAEKYHHYNTSLSQQQHQLQRR